MSDKFEGCSSIIDAVSKIQFSFVIDNRDDTLKKVTFHAYAYPQTWLDSSRILLNHCLIISAEFIVNIWTVISAISEIELDEFDSHIQAAVRI